MTDVTVMPSEGKYAVLEDPQGVAFGVYTSPTDAEPEDTAKLGEFSWHELATDDFRAAFEFYSALFGWEALAEHDMGAPLGTYFTFGRGGVEIGGMFKRTPEMPSSWLGYVRVKDLSQTIKRAASAGGTVILEPMEVPGGDWVAQFNDPQGGTFAVHTFAADLKRAEEPVAPPAETEDEAVETESTEAQAAVAGATRRAAGKKAASKKVAKKSVKKAARKSTGAKKAAKNRAGAKKKAVSKKKTSVRKKAAKKAAPRRAARGASQRRTSAKRAGGARRPARKVARGAKSKNSTKKRSGVKKSVRARKAK